jgi:hypothetical protein
MSLGFELQAMGSIPRRSDAIHFLNFEDKGDRICATLSMLIRFIHRLIQAELDKCDRVVDFHKAEALSAW